MNILYFLDVFPKISESFVLNEIYELEQRGHNVAVYALSRPDEHIVHEEFGELDIPIHYERNPTYTDVTELFSTRILRPRVLKNAFYPAPPQRHAANLFRAKHCIEFVDTLEWKPDHFHTHFASLPKFGAQYAADYFQVPFTITTHAFDLYSEPVGEYTSSLLKRADRIVTISEYNREQIRKRFAPETPIDIVRAGIRPEKFSPTGLTESNRVLTISRFVEKKGLPYALEAVDIAAEQVPGIEYHMIGSGELESELVQKVEQLGIENQVTFLNNVSDQRLVTELDEAQCFVLPCIVTEQGNRDGIPVVLMESMAMKTPPVSTTVSGIPELIDHEENGLLVEPRDTEAIAEAVVALLEDPHKCQDFAERAREKVVAEFDIEKEAGKLEAVFQAANREN